MKGIKSENLLAVLDFIYFGEVMICQENLETFMDIAEDLQIEGLAADVSNVSASVVNEGIEEYESEEKATHHKKEALNDKSTIVSIQTLDENTAELNEKIRRFLFRTEKKMPNGHPTFSCKACGKEGHRAGITNHIEIYHIGGLSLDCKICGRIYRTRRLLKLHKCSSKKTKQFLEILHDSTNKN